jgi:integrase
MTVDTTTALYEASGVPEDLGPDALTPQRRYEIVSANFPDWLLSEPILFPAHHPTFGWACRVPTCDGAVSSTYTGRLCTWHAKELRGSSLPIDEFLQVATPCSAPKFGWALRKYPECGVCGLGREAIRQGYCMAHASSLDRARERGIDEIAWRTMQKPHPRFPACCIPACVHNGEFNVKASTKSRRLCRRHQRKWIASLQGGGVETSTDAWKAWYTKTAAGASVYSVDMRGMLTLAKVSERLQREIRWAIYRHDNTARRTQWMPQELQRVVDMIADNGITTLSDPLLAELAANQKEGTVKRILLTLPIAGRRLASTAEMAKEEGWFDPSVVGAEPFPGVAGEDHRSKVWHLTAISQRWLRDLMWEHLRDVAMSPKGKCLGAGTVYKRINGIVLISANLRDNRGDRGEKPALLGSSDAHAIKETWDLWYEEQCPIPRMIDTPRGKPNTLTEINRAHYMSGVRAVFGESRAKRRTPPVMDSFIIALPKYPRPRTKPRPRPLTYGDFQLLVSADSISLLEIADGDDCGLADIWLTQAFQGGRINETLRLKLGCIGLVGAAQPYIWRDISKVGVLDYGMPCYLPIYERLLARQEKTRARLRSRYSSQLASLDEDGRERLEAHWDKTMPLFPGPKRNIDLEIEVSQCWFRDVFLRWIEDLGLKGITSHQTRATLATSLLNNGAPAMLVRQLLGHFSTEALAHYANYNNDSMTKQLQQVWAAGPGMDKPGTILLRPAEVQGVDPAAAAARIDLTVVPVEHGLCRYGPVVGGAQCPFEKNCTNGPAGPCEHFVLTGADLAYWERKRDAAYHFAEGAPSEDARDYILGQWLPWEVVLTNLRQALDDLGLLQDAEKLDLRTPMHDYFHPLFSSAWQLSELASDVQQTILPESE